MADEKDPPGPFDDFIDRDDDIPGDGMIDRDRDVPGGEIAPDPGYRAFGDDFEDPLADWPGPDPEPEQRLVASDDDRDAFDDDSSLDALAADLADFGAAQKPLQSQPEPIPSAPPPTARPVPDNDDSYLPRGAEPAFPERADERPSDSLAGTAPAVDSDEPDFGDGSWTDADDSEVDDVDSLARFEAEVRSPPAPDPAQDAFIDALLEDDATAESAAETPESLVDSPVEDPMETALSQVSGDAGEPPEAVKAENPAPIPLDDDELAALAEDSALADGTDADDDNESLVDEMQDGDASWPDHDADDRDSLAAELETATSDPDAEATMTKAPETPPAGDDVEPENPPAAADDDSLIDDFLTDLDDEADDLLDPEDDDPPSAVVSAAAAALAAAEQDQVGSAKRSSRDAASEGPGDRPARIDDEDDSDSSRLPWIMIAVAVVAIALLGVGGYGVLQQRATLQNEVRDLQAKLATAITPEQAREQAASKLGALEARVSELDGQLADLRAERDSLSQRVDTLGAELEAERTRGAEALAEAEKQAAARRSAATPKPAPKPEPNPSATTPAAITAAPDGRWFVNFGSYAARSVAESWSKRLEVTAGKVVIQETVSDGRSLYRLRIIGLGDRDSAESVATALERRFDLPRLWVGRE